MTTVDHAALPDPGSELSRLTAGLLDGSLTVADRDQLVVLLADPQARGAYRKIIWLHANLLRLWTQDMSAGWTPQPAAAVDDDGPSNTPGSLSWLPSTLSDWISAGLSSRAWRAAVLGCVATIMTAALIIFVVSGGLFGPQPALTTIRRPPRVAGAIAEIAGVELPVWAESGRAWSVWDGLLPGAILELQSGRVELAFDAGARVVVEGPAVFAVDRERAVELKRGKAAVTARGERDSAGGPRFTVQTPTATVTDIGTSFGVAVDQAGETSVTVFDGLVDLVPRLAGAQPLRLTAGEAGAVSQRRRVRKTAPPAERFVRSLERPSADLEASLAVYGWDESRATTVYRDSFAGSGPLAGARPADRGGFGDAAWAAPEKGWDLQAGDPPTLVATAAGSALLPFCPEAGRLYLVSARIHATEGGAGFGAVGFTDQPRPEFYIPNGPWAMQRHAPGIQPNECFAGPTKSNRVGRADMHAGSHTRTILLDTTASHWRVVFFIDGKRIGEHTYGARPTLSHVCLSAFPFTRVQFSHFLISSLIPSVGQ